MASAVDNGVKHRQKNRQLNFVISNTAIAGDNPDPTPEAKAHLAQVLKQLELSEFAYNS